MFNELLKIALEYYPGNAEKARQEVLDCMADMKKTLSEAEREFFAEKSGAFINDGYSAEEADAATLDMVIKKRPSRSTASAEIPPQARKSMTRQNNLDGLKNYVKGRSA